MPLAARQSAASPLALIVDRDDDTRGMYAAYLQQTYGNTDEASDGRDALAKAIALRPDVIITETRLPGIDGFELCAILRRDAATRSTRIVVVTADGMPAAVDRARRAGADLVLVKPCLPDALLTAIRSLGTPDEPVAAQPDLICPACDRPLRHVQSHVGGVSAHQPERWDYYECVAGCGTFQYRHRTRKVRRV